MAKGKVNTKVATEEVKNWLKKNGYNIPEEGNELIDAYIENVARFVSDGSLIILENGNIKQVLKQNLGEGEIKELTYSPRFEIGTFYENFKGLDQGDSMGRTIALLATMSVDKYPMSVIKKMFRVDYVVASSISVFF